MPKRILCLFAAICFASAAHASVEVVAQALSPNLILSSSGVGLATGDVVWIGYFNGPANPATDNSFSDLSASFKSIGNGNSDGDTLDEFVGGNQLAGDTMEINDPQGAGTFGASFNGINATYFGANPGAGNVQLYLWIFNSSTPSAATQWGIYTDTAWVFPSDGTEVGVNLASSNVDVVRGAPSGSDFELATIPSSVPEPTSLAAVGSAIIIGAAALSRRRTRA